MGLKILMYCSEIILKIVQYLIKLRMEYDTVNSLSMYLIN